MSATAGTGDDGGYEPFIASSGRQETEIRVVPESAVAEAVAAERERIRRLAVQFGAMYEHYWASEPLRTVPPTRELRSELRPFADLITDDANTIGGDAE